MNCGIQRNEILSEKRYIARAYYFFERCETKNILCIYSLPWIWCFLHLISSYVRLFKLLFPWNVNLEQRTPNSFSYFSRECSTPSTSQTFITSSKKFLGWCIGGATNEKCMIFRKYKLSNHICQNFLIIQSLVHKLCPGVVTWEIIKNSTKWFWQTVKL